MVYALLTAAPLPPRGESWPRGTHTPCKAPGIIYPGGAAIFVIPHQANLRIVEGLEKMLKLPNATTIKKVHKYGNTSAASIPTALVDALEEGEIKGGEVAVFTAVGAGLSWGACAVRLGKRTTPINTSDAKLPDFDGKAVDTIRRAIEYQIPDKLDLI